jgi:hypothetical protein
VEEAAAVERHKKNRTANLSFSIFGPTSNHA